MDDVGSIAGDDSLDLNSAARKATSRGRKASSASRGRPRSANSATAAANNRKINGPGTAITAKSRGKVNRRQQAQGQGSRMRAGGDGDDNNAGASSVVTPSDTIGPRSNSIEAARTSGSVDFGGRGLRRKTRKSVANTIALNQQSEDDEKSSIIEAEDAAGLLQQLESRNQEVESRCRHLENRCTQLEGVVKRSTYPVTSVRSPLYADDVCWGAI